MSLVSTINAEERADFLDASANPEDIVGRPVPGTFQEKPIVTKTIRGYSIYQTDEGAQLSKEALFRAKVKYGIYQSPARSRTKGVTGREASDVAANLAHNNRRTVEAYKRLFVDRDAHTAARKSLISGQPHAEVPTVSKFQNGSHVAATRAYSVTSNNAGGKVKRLQNPSKPPASKTQPAKVANKSKVTQHTEVVPKKRTTKQMDLSKVLSSAESRAQVRVNDRLTSITIHPGVLTSTQNLHQVRSTSLTGPVYKERKTVKEVPLTDHSEVKRSAKVHSKRSAASAASAVLGTDPDAIVSDDFEERERERRKLFSQITSEQVLTKARENADKKLNSMVAKDSHRALFGNESYNKAAIKRVQKNSQREIEEQHKGKIDLGGGLWLSPDDINVIAKEMVDPLLGEVHQRADDQRATDVDIKDRNEHVTSEWKAWMAMHKAKEHNNEALLFNSQNKRTREADAAKNEAERNLTELCSKMDKQVAERTQLLNQTKKTREELEKETEERLEQNKKDNKAVLKDFKAQHADELEQAREEQKRLVEPYEERLQEANLQHENLIQQRLEINEEIAALRESVEDHQAQILKYEREIEYHEEQNANMREELGNLEADREDLEAHCNDTLVVSANKAKEQAQLSTEEARLKNLEVEAIINERKSELNRTERELQREKLNMLEAMRKTAEVRGDGNIDEERVKGLIGTTFSEYAEKEKLQGIASKPERKASKKAERAQKTEKPTIRTSWTSGDDDDEINAREFKEIAEARAREAREKYSPTENKEATASVAQEELSSERSISKSKTRTSGTDVGPFSDNGSTVSHVSNANDTHDPEGSVEQGISSGDHQSSYFKEVF